MKKQLIRFPSIEGFRHVIYNVNRHAEFDGLDGEGNSIVNPSNPKPIIPFKGTVKLHGTNAGVCWNGEELWTQSKGNVITPEKDNQGFAFFVESNKELFIELLKNVSEFYGAKEGEGVAVYGEWCGKGIQSGVGINELAKMFVIFKIKIATVSEEEPNRWIDYDYNLLNVGAITLASQIHFIQEFPSYDIIIDFNKPEESQNRLVELTLEVEKQCPVAKHLGAEGIGEGIVWTGDDDGNNYVFKVKGEKHSASKVKKLAPVDIEKIKNVNVFVEYAVTENRLEQGIAEVFTVPNIEINKKELGSFIKWVQSDVIKEESDTLAGNGLEPKDIQKAVSTKAVKYFMSKYS